MTRIFYDTEFIEDGHTIELVSIGMVAENGDEMYAVSSEFNVERLLANQWLRDNVAPHLPWRTHDRGFRCKCINGRHLDVDHPNVRSRAQIARLVQEFILSRPEPELWAWYGAYDHVVLAQLFGPMIDLPSGIPMWTNDLQQEIARRKPATVPAQDSAEHAALSAAGYVKRLYEHIAT